MTDNKQEPEQAATECEEITEGELAGKYRDAYDMGKNEKQSSAMSQAAKGLAALGGFEKNKLELTDNRVSPADLTPGADAKVTGILGESGPQPTPETLLAAIKAHPELGSILAGATAKLEGIEEAEKVVGGPCLETVLEKMDAENTLRDIAAQTPDAHEATKH